jgi:signal transduction histidine kinase
VSVLRWALVGTLLGLATAQVGLSAWVFRNKRGREALLLSMLLVCIAVSAAGTATQVSVNSLDTKVAIMAVWTPFFWLGVPLFVGLTLTIAGYPHWLTRRTAVVGGLFGLVCAVCSLANPAYEVLHMNYHLATEPFPVLTYDRTLVYQVVTSITLGSMLFALTLLVPTLLKSKRWGVQEGAVLVSANLPTFLVGLVLLTNTHLEFHPLIVASGVLILAYGLVFIDQQHIVGETLARQTALSHVTEGIILLNTDGTVSDYNYRAAQIFPVLTDTIGERVDTLDPSLWAAAAGSKSNDLEVTEDGDSRVYRVAASEVTVGGRDYGYVLTLHDVTRIRKREQELERQNERLDAFAGTISHDLRNPLNVAQLRLDLVKEECNSEHLAAVDEAHGRMNDLIDDVLGLTRAGQDVDETESVVLEEVARDAWRHTETNGCDVEIVLPETATVKADRQRLLQMFENLYRNAIDHNRPPLTVEVGPLDGDGPELAGLYVEDDGTGIPADERDEIFSHGYSTADGGTGLGLAIVETSVRAHDWTIGVTESDDGGARFEIRTE